MEKITLNISGMTCDGCASKVVHALEGVDGVAMVEVSLEQGKAFVTYDSRTTNPDDLFAAVDDAGFDAGY
ncbi:heavy-metal-associated domain-containing protein [Komagataeibacter intermedius]|uniref:Metal-binding protein n=2 Tax=Komagataeibacter intermedius TaxID=66229 RepID=A0A0N0MGP1_9PROT|nr:heavy-metal-associated domain-containing protein [Komagataeibacter intermedius]KPH88986.1 metal-binding protein [Komagataeibacter intermedius AF2]MCF3635053.1 heavy-metal-associated domain-containing protein [Komagataeibacter intermedius]GAN87574.1 cation/copper resistance transporter ATPase CopZ [Komagataeibacter intermedius TF2]GBQ66217.1 cation/copper resistance transporter ATPase CopZ [Komagataeibacter intermedius NRIC 0521]